MVKELSEKSAEKVSKEEYYPDNIIMELKCFSLDLNQAEKICHRCHRDLLGSMI